MKNIVIFGPPGSGKGTQSDQITANYGLNHISTGEVLRTEIAQKTPKGLLAQKFIDNGQLVPDELIIDMLANKLDSNNIEKGIIFDGFPRTTAQAASLKSILNERGTDVTIMLSLEVEKKELINRLLKRGEVSGRSDDNLETIEKRIAVYHNQTAPVINFYKSEGTHVAINGMGSVNDIFSEIAKVLDQL